MSGSLTLLVPVTAREALDGGRIGNTLVLPVGTQLPDERDSWRRYIRTFPRGVFVLTSVLLPGASEWRHVRIPATETLAVVEPRSESP